MNFYRYLPRVFSDYGEICMHIVVFNENRRRTAVLFLWDYVEIQIPGHRNPYEALNIKTSFGEG
jgi:hypothetical protein